MRILIICILFLSQLSEVYAAVLLTSRESRAVLQLHNSYRTSVGVPRLKTSLAVSQSALKWASALEARDCILEHSSAIDRNGYGENLYAQWATPGLSLSPGVGVSVWGEERLHYSYESNACATGKICGHYTQMIWRTTTGLGCAKARCLANGLQTDVLVCQYNPAGNYLGTRPY